MKRWMREWPDATAIRALAREHLLRALDRRNELIAQREQQKAEGRPLRNMTLTARDDVRQKFDRVAARFYRMAEEESRSAP